MDKQNGRMAYGHTPVLGLGLFLMDAHVLQLNMAAR